MMNNKTYLIQYYMEMSKVKNQKKEYALYKGDTFLAMGTIKEIASMMKVKPRTIAFYTTPTYKKRIAKGKNRREVIEC